MDADKCEEVNKKNIQCVKDEEKLVESQFTKECERNKICSTTESYTEQMIKDCSEDTIRSVENDDQKRNEENVLPVNITKGSEEFQSVKEIGSDLIDSETTPDTNESNLNQSDSSGNERNNQSIIECSSNSSKDTFKIPLLLIGPRKGLPTKVKTLPNNAASKSSTSLEESNDDLKNKLAPILQRLEKWGISIETIKEKKTSYTEPSWSGVPGSAYKLEVLKSGLILEVIDLSDKSYHVIGRLPDCDISMAHPTISRYHAVFRYRSIGDENNEKGLYLYDLNSTHGTFWNGNRIKPRIYVRLRGGHMIKFGCSQRKFIVQARDDDQEQESEYTVTELKEIRRLQLEEQERLEKLRLLEEEEEQKLRKEKEESEGIDWGMKEDADEETDLTENPYAQSNNEELC